jgi:hypothetical protein
MDPERGAEVALHVSNDALSHWSGFGSLRSKGSWTAIWTQERYSLEKRLEVDVIAFSLIALSLIALVLAVSPMQTSLQVRRSRESDENSRDHRPSTGPPPWRF